MNGLSNWIRDINFNAEYRSRMMKTFTIIRFANRCFELYLITRLFFKFPFVHVSDSIIIEMKNNDTRVTLRTIRPSISAVWQLRLMARFLFAIMSGCCVKYDWNTFSMSCYDELICRFCRISCYKLPELWISILQDRPIGFAVLLNMREWEWAPQMLNFNKFPARASLIVRLGDLLRL